VRLLLDGPVRFHDLRRAIPEISDKMLSERLKELEAAGLVLRQVIPETPCGSNTALHLKGQALEALSTPFLYGLRRGSPSLKHNSFNKGICVTPLDRTTTMTI
jgi:hypothetical protein